MAAALDVLGAKGYLGATTKEMAERAGLSEMTLFRRFGSKDELLAAAMKSASSEFRGAAVSPTDDVVADLVDLARTYAAFIDRWPRLIDRVLPEAEADGLFGLAVLELINGNVDSVKRLLRHHQRRGNIAKGPADELVRTFMGPILARASLRHVLNTVRFRPEAHVDHFLSGYGSR